MPEAHVARWATRRRHRGRIAARRRLDLAVRTGAVNIFVWRSQGHHGVSGARVIARR